MDEQYLYVDSRLRNTPDSNSYTLMLNTPIYSVTRVDLVSACIPTLQSQNTLSTSDPYVFLDIEQFRSKYGVQSVRSNVIQNIDTSPTIYGYFAHVFYGDVRSARTLTATSNIIQSAPGNTLTTYTYANVTPYINYTEQQYKSSVTFKQPIESVYKLNIRWVDRTNNPVSFNPVNSEHGFMLRLYTSRKHLDDYSPLKRPDPVEREKRFSDVHTYLILFVMLIGIFTLFMFRSSTTVEV